MLLEVLHEHRQLHCTTGNLRASRVAASAGTAMPPPTQLSAPHLQCSLSICAAWQVFVGNHAKQVAAWVPPAAELDSNVSRSPPPSGWAGCSCCCCLTWLCWDGRAVLRAAPRQRVCLEAGLTAFCCWLHPTPHLLTRALPHTSLPPWAGAAGRPLRLGALPGHGRRPLALLLRLQHAAPGALVAWDLLRLRCGALENAAGCREAA